MLYNVFVVNLNERKQNKMKLYQSVLIWIMLLGIPFAAACGWVMNIGSLLYSNEGVARIALRVVGIFIFPLGCVLGYF
jgi:hypothetical protein